MQVTDGQHQLKYAGFWIRLWATVIDMVLFLIISIPIGLILSGDMNDVIGPGANGPPGFLLGWVFPAIATIAFWASKGATPGKMAIGARILNAQTGEPPSTGQCVGRYFACFISFLPLFLGALWIGWDARKQGWHDNLDGTVVVRRSRSGPEPVHFPEKA